MNPSEILLHVASILDSLGVEYAVVGSMASSAWGIPRSTNDADIVASLGPAHVPGLVEALSRDFYVDSTAIDRAIRTGRSFNAIHLTSAFKVGIFVPPSGGFGLQQVARRRHEPVGPGPGAGSLAVASPEDVILAKLRWLADAGSASDRQWQDVLGVMKVQGERLDLACMRQWASSLGVLPLLERALGDAGQPGE